MCMCVPHIFVFKKQAMTTRAPVCGLCMVTASAALCHGHHAHLATSRAAATKACVVCLAALGTGAKEQRAEATAAVGAPDQPNRQRTCQCRRSQQGVTGLPMMLVLVLLLHKAAAHRHARHPRSHAAGARRRHPCGRQRAQRTHLGIKPPPANWAPASPPKPPPANMLEGVVCGVWGGGVGGLWLGPRGQRVSNEIGCPGAEKTKGCRRPGLVEREGAGMGQGFAQHEHIFEALASSKNYTRAA